MSSSDPETVEPKNDQAASRLEKLRKIRELGHDPWGGRFDGISSLQAIRDRADEVQFVQASGEQVGLPPMENPETNFRQWLADQGEGELRGPQIRAAGRIIRLRNAGKLIFLDLRDWTSQLQVLIGKRQVGENWQLAQCFDLGDIVGVDGHLLRTKTGELTLFAEQLEFLTKSLEPHPEKYHGLSDPELRQRRRYLDLIHGEGVLGRFVRRNEIIGSVRKTLADRQFVEVEGPTLHAIPGGAAARPFLTHHNALDMQLHLRIALELHLKRLLVGGMERVYELGRVYRNEGISPKHNPEFTMLEVYQAYGDYQTMMELTEQCVISAIQATGQGLQLPFGDATIDFTPPFSRRTYDELFQDCTNVDPHDEVGIRQLAKRLEIDTTGRHPDIVKNDLFEHRVEESLSGPVFVLDYPASICPLTKRKRDNPALAERFELFVQGMEIANAYTELNDPTLQEQLFRTQLAGLAEEDSMARMDHDFLWALRYGMPPAGGLGIGIDRLVMLLTNSPSIREVILFPLLRLETPS